MPGSDEHITSDSARDLLVSLIFTAQSEDIVKVSKLEVVSLRSPSLSLTI